MPGEPSQRAGYEIEDANTRGLAYFVALITILLALTALVCMGLFGALRSTQNPPGIVAPLFERVRPIPPAPQLQSDPLNDYERFRREQQQLLNSYGWVNQQQGIARIPIKEAMDLLIKQGVPVRPQQASTPAEKHPETNARGGAVTSPGRAGQQ